MTYSTLRLSTANHIAHITLYRPHDRNAITEQMAQELHHACERIRQDDNIRAGIIAGAGDHFCAGTHPQPDSLTAQHIARLRVGDAIAAVEKPMIALIQGDALDQGLELALACDLRIASADAKLGLTQIAYGLIPWDGGTQRLPRLIGQSSATHMILTSRTLSASEALHIGLLNHKAESAEAAAEYAATLAHTIAAQGPIAVRYLKEALIKGADMTLAQGLGLEADLNIILQSTADRSEGIASFLHRKPPHYQGK